MKQAEIPSKMYRCMTFADIWRQMHPSSVTKNKNKIQLNICIWKTSLLKEIL